MDDATDDARPTDRPTPEENEAAARRETRKLMERVTVRSAMLTGIFVLLVMYTLYAAATLFAPLVVAFLTSLIFTPVVRALRPLRIAPPVSAAVIVCLVFSLAVSALYGLSEPAMEWLEKAPGTCANWSWNSANWRRPWKNCVRPTNRSRASPRRGRQRRRWRPGALEPGEVAAVRHLVGAVRHRHQFRAAVLHAGLRRHLPAQAGAGDPQFENKRAAVATVREIQNRISIYLGTISIINLCLAAVSALILYILDVPNPILFGVMVGMFNYAPYIGPVASFTVILLVSLLHFDGSTPPCCRRR